MARVFISYRRSETRWAAGRLYDRLAEVIGREHLFFDVSDIEPGEDFVQRIREIVGACDVLIALIRPTWSAVQDGSGKPRLMNPRDLVRIEIASALQRNIRVIPILIDGAVMPRNTSCHRTWPASSPGTRTTCRAHASTPTSTALSASSIASSRCPAPRPPRRHRRRLPHRRSPHNFPSPSR